MIWLELLFAFWAGGIIGAIGMALLCASRNSEEEARR